VGALPLDAADDAPSASDECYGDALVVRA